MKEQQLWHPSTFKSSSKSGTNITIFKIFSPKKWRKIGVFLLKALLV
jgi:hypothetical protein